MALVFCRNIYDSDSCWDTHACYFSWILDTSKFLWLLFYTSQKNDRQDLVYAELSDFTDNVDNRGPLAANHTEYADIAHVLREDNNDYEDIPARAIEGDYATIDDVKRSDSISV